MAMRIATAGSWWSTWLPRMKALTLATVPADMSMPPVSMVIVWQPASRASGMANCSVCAAQRGLMMPGRRKWRPTISSARRISSGMIG